MTLKATLGTACAAAALIAMAGAAYADGKGYTRTYGKDKVEIYISVKSGAYADVDYQKSYRRPTELRTLNVVPYPSQKPKIKEETAIAWGEVKKVKIEAQGVTSGTWDAHYSSNASTHSKSHSSGGGGGGSPQASSSSSGGGYGGGCGCSSSSTTSASASGGTSGSWSTGS